jgi:hypothetical protein
LRLGEQDFHARNSWKIELSLDSRAYEIILFRLVLGFPH